MRNIFLFLCCLVFFLSCEDKNKQSESGSTPYNPALLVEVTEFMPDAGRIREKVIIKGHNFGTDKSQVKVYFVDELTERAATVIGVDNNTIYCLTPRQLDGENKIKIVVHGKDATAESKFKYTVAENVSTIAGSAANTATEDGTLAEAKFNYLQGIGALGNESMLVFQKTDPCVRYVSIPDNAVITVHSGFAGGKPAVTKDKTKVYAAGWDSPHTIYRYTKASGWAPERIGQLGITFGKIRAVALDKNEELLYFCDAAGKFGYYEIATQKVVTLNASTDAITSDGNYLIYNWRDDHFYVSCAAKYGIYRINPDGRDVETYAGFNGGVVRDGYVGEECAFAQPDGLTLNEDGDIYVCEGFKAHVIRKISIIDNYVSTVAGYYDGANDGSQIDGSPIDARFNYPYDIDNDGEGNYWIVEGWGNAVRKYAVE
ncbi:MAG: hypothetical protein EZS26_000950 [Candidatus Ordinivivax streblomastigis]|uniref:IPT/TIG domain-containing protein n=1 Tax=Candidatus Ordinivivax streblomastigis TaxID=2540710 RepID=A0A5M8P3F0_9BACT|nr:MAG: hypothetical protein EZS26_000950 [Candidatus Ordinivivax streblomastigis]